MYPAKGHSKSFLQKKSRPEETKSTLETRQSFECNFIFQFEVKKISDGGSENFQTKKGCPVPVQNGITMTVVDKFERNNRFGFVFLLEVDKTKLTTETYSIVHEYSDGVFGANFQTWNLNFFGFYDKEWSKL